MDFITSNSILDAWKKGLELLRKKGLKTMDDNQALSEILQLFIVLENPVDEEEKISIVNPSMADWMKANFEHEILVPELGNAKSYGCRLRNYKGRNQLQWVKEKLRNKPETKSATITMLMPDEDKSYVPCVSLLDFKLRNNTLHMTATCRSLDFGKKALFNFLALKRIADEVKDELSIPNLTLTVHIISAHVYEKDWSFLPE
ncbi:MAG: thymidylate synthase [Candidatus Jordarchaeaceae archaeon]